MSESLVGPSEVSSVLGVHRSTAHRWITSGQLGGWVRLPDGSPRIAREQIQRWVAAHTFGGSAPILFFKEKEEDLVRGRRSSKR